MVATEIRLLIDRYLAAYNSFDGDGMIACLSSDVRFENISGGAVTHETDGLDAFKSLAEQSTALFLERHQSLRGLTQGEDGILIAEIGFRGIFAQDIPDGPKAGEIIEILGISEFLIANGKIARIIDRG